jgi:alkylation response protein AidB-like acyl-CoA dehydrogenase
VTDAASTERKELQAVVRQFLQRESQEGRVRETMASEDGFDQAIWGRMAELGLQGLMIPESLGGAGGDFRDMAVVLEEMGAALLCGPFFASAVLATIALLESGDAGAQQAFLPPMAAGTQLGTLALSEPAGRWDLSSIETTAERFDEEWRITGVKSFVLDGCLADVILVAAATGAGPTLFAVRGDAPGLTRTQLTVLDQTRRQARLDLQCVPARMVGAEGQAWSALARTLDRAAVALAAEQVGGAQRCLDMAVSYAKIRYQFGRPIGSFQAIKHMCAYMLVDVESARSAAYLAVEAAAAGAADLSLMASLAKASCSDAYQETAAQNIQVHGGIGFTWDHPAHLYFRRAKSSALLLGNSAYHRELAADLLEI